MRALVCHELGAADRLRIEQRPSPVLTADQVRVAVKAAALNFPDVLAVAGKYQFKAPLPFVPGGEAAGIVTEVGSGVRDYSKGDAVIFGGIHGAFAEELCVAPESLLAMPAGMDFVTAAGFNVTYSTSYYALKQRAALQPGETLLVLGAAGGVGLAACDIGAALGARVIAAASTSSKLDAACAAGATERINYATESLKDRIKTLTGGRGVDVVYDAIGGDYSEPALRAMAWNGRFLVVGFAAGNIASIPLNLPLLKSCAIVGVFLGAWREKDPAGYRQNFAELTALYSAGRLKPRVSRTFALDQYREAFGELSERRAIGKVVFTMDSSLA